MYEKTKWIKETLYTTKERKRVTNWNSFKIVEHYNSPSTKFSPVLSFDGSPIHLIFQGQIATCPFGRLLFTHPILKSWNFKTYFSNFKLWFCIFGKQTRHFTRIIITVKLNILVQTNIQVCYLTKYFHFHFIHNWPHITHAIQVQQAKPELI